MKTFTVYENADPPGDRLDRAEMLVFLPDGFSVAASLLAPAWMLGHAMWLVFVSYLALVGGLVVLGALGVSVTVIGLCLFGLHLAIGFEAASLRRWTLERQGWQSLGVVTGDTEVQCERRFFEAWLADTPLRAASDLRSGRPMRAWWRRGRSGPA